MQKYSFQTMLLKNASQEIKSNLRWATKTSFNQIKVIKLSTEAIIRLANLKSNKTNLL